MRNRVINAQLNHLGVDHDQLHIFRTCLIQQADNNGVHAHRLTGTGGTCNQHMGQFGDITHDAVTADIFAHSKGRFGLGVAKLIGIDNLPQGNRGDRTVGHFNTHHTDLSGHSGNTHAGSTQAQGNIIGNGGQLIQTHALFQLHFISGQHWDHVLH